MERVLAIGAIVLLAGALSLSEYGRLRQQQANGALAEDLGVARSEADAALNAVIPPQVLADADKSVYMVMDDAGYFGTAFVIDRERGLLATAAHVASVLPLDIENPSVHILNRFTGKPLRVRARHIHSGYGAFRRVAEIYQPIDPQSRAIDPKAVALSDFANDAAVLFVDPIDPKTGENILGPALPIASEASLLKIGAGDPIAVVGFPFDVITQPNAEKSAASRVERGVVAATIAPIDLADDGDDPVSRNLIVHRMATAPGSSGGPVLNRRGEVVGINTHGYDSPASNGDALAQRADVLYDLIGSLREADVIDRVYKVNWENRLSRWLKAKDVIPFSKFYRNAPVEDGKNFDLKLADVNLAEKMPFRSKTIDMSFGPRQKKYAVMAPDLIEQPDGDSAQEDQPGDDKKADRTIIRATPTPLFMIDKPGQYAEAKFVLSRNENHVVYAFDYAVGYNAVGYCRVAIHHRLQGAQELKTSSPHPMPELFIPSEPGPNGMRRIHIVFQRPACGGATPEFFAGVVSWKDGATPPANAITVRPSILDRAPVIGHTSAVGARVSALACSLKLPGLADCPKSIAVLYGAAAAHAEASSLERAIPIVSIDAGE